MSTKKEETITLRIAKNKTDLLEQFKRTPIVQIACEKAGVSRATVYRWRDSDKEFAKAMDQAMLEGRLLVNDVAESQLMAAIRERNMSAIFYWLKHHHPSYATKVEVNAIIKESHELSPEETALRLEALRRAALPKVAGVLPADESEQ